jgi:hypothetical protein
MILSTHGIVGSSIGQITTLLDLYPSAAAAYSLRLLRVGYTGSAIRVRRASDNTEQDIGFVSNLLDTSSLTSFCSGTNGFVTTWYDQSGNGYDATQSTAASQPQIVSGGSVISENGKPSVQFIKSNLNFLQYTFSSALIQPGTYFVVNQNTSSFSVIASNSNTTRWQIYRDNIQKTFRIYGGADLNSGINSDNQLLIYGLFNGTSSSIGINSTTTINGNAGTLNNTAIRMGRDASNTYGDNKMQEVILYNSDQSSNRTGIETNINDFYSIY